MSGFIFKFIALFLGAIIGTSLFLIPYLNRLAAIEKKSEIKINNQIIIAEVVKDAKEREQGLSGRADIGINEGMLFLFDKEGRHGFWMKGMRFPIDIIWINGMKIVGIEENLEPEPGVSDSELKVYYPPEPVDKALELKAGRAAILRAKPGDVVKIRPLVRTGN